MTLNAERTVTVSLPQVVAQLGQGPYLGYNILAKSQNLSFEYGIVLSKLRREITYGPFNKHLKDDNTFVSTIMIIKGIREVEIINITVNIIGKDTTLSFDQIYSKVSNNFPDKLELH